MKWPDSDVFINGIKIENVDVELTFNEVPVEEGATIMGHRINVPSDEATLLDRLVISYTKVLMDDASRRKIIEGDGITLYKAIMSRAHMMAEHHLSLRTKEVQK